MMKTLTKLKVEKKFSNMIKTIKKTPKNSMVKLGKLYLPDQKKENVCVSIYIYIYIYMKERDTVIQHV